MRVSEGVLPTPKEPRTDPPTRDVDAPTPAWKRWWCAPLGPVELQFRRDTVEPAVWTTLLVCPPVAIYAVLARPHAQAIALCILCGLTAAGSILTLRLPWDRYVRSPWREAYYGTWWVVDFSMIVIATVLGGGPTSPLLLLAFIQLVFTAISYPERVGGGRHRPHGAHADRARDRVRGTGGNHADHRDRVRGDRVDGLSRSSQPRSPRPCAQRQRAPTRRGAGDRAHGFVGVALGHRPTRGLRRAAPHLRRPDERR